MQLIAPKASFLLFTSSFGCFQEHLCGTKKSIYFLLNMCLTDWISSIHTGASDGAENTITQWGWGGIMRQPVKSIDKGLCLIMCDCVFVCVILCSLRFASIFSENDSVIMRNWGRKSTLLPQIQLQRCSCSPVLCVESNFLAMHSFWLQKKACGRDMVKFGGW